MTCGPNADGGERTRGSSRVLRTNYPRRVRQRRIPTTRPPRATTASTLMQGLFWRDCRSPRLAAGLELLSGPPPASNLQAHAVAASADRRVRSGALLGRRAGRANQPARLLTNPCTSKWRATHTNEVRAAFTLFSPSCPLLNRRRRRRSTGRAARRSGPRADGPRCAARSARRPLRACLRRRAAACRPARESCAARSFRP